MEPTERLTTAPWVMTPTVLVFRQIYFAEGQLGPKSACRASAFDLNAKAFRRSPRRMPAVRRRCVF